MTNEPEKKQHHPEETAKANTAPETDLAPTVEPALATDFEVPETGLDSNASSKPAVSEENTQALVPTAPVVPEIEDSSLAIVRLGSASVLFSVLRHKSMATASHALRIALICSDWGRAIGMKGESLDLLEVAALLHDIGIVGVPDRVLQKPQVLDSDEAELMAAARSISVDLLRSAGATDALIDIVRLFPAWYDGTRTGFPESANQIPIASRMIAIVEAYDSMTAGRVYRPAISEELAVAELFACAGAQFDPDLVDSFIENIYGNSTDIQRRTARRWLDTLDGQLPGSLGVRQPEPSISPIQDAFEAKLLENMYDAVVFFDASSRISLWNRGAERMTGISGQNVIGHPWHPDLLELRDEHGERLGEGECPVSTALRSGVQSLRRLSIVGKSGKHTAVDTHTIPVTGKGGERLGAILLFHDATSVTSLERRCQTLHEKATIDPLTQVANRAEFDRVLESFVEAHQESKVPCSLIFLDADRFKRVNDDYGHQAGDDVLVSLGSLLKDSCRAGDLVARYGGEEFIMLCANCDVVTAAKRADEIRQAFSKIPHDRLGGRCVSASFGVTEIQPGDTPETMLRRADRALIMAKESGRNRVIQLGVGNDVVETNDVETIRKPAKRSLLTRIFGRKQKSTSIDILIERELATPVPMKMTLEKLRGFITDQQARVDTIQGNDITLIVDSGVIEHGDRRDPGVPLRMELEFKELKPQSGEVKSPMLSMAQTSIRVVIRPVKLKDIENPGIDNMASKLLASCRAYLMAVIVAPEGNTPPEQKKILKPWK